MVNQVVSPSALASKAGFSTGAVKKRMTRTVVTTAIDIVIEGTGITRPNNIAPGRQTDCVGSGAVIMINVGANAPVTATNRNTHAPVSRELKTVCLTA